MIMDVNTRRSSIAAILCACTTLMMIQFDHPWTGPSLTSLAVLDDRHRYIEKFHNGYKTIVPKLLTSPPNSHMVDEK